MIKLPLARSVMVLLAAGLLSGCAGRSPLCGSDYVPVVSLETGMLRCVEYEYFEHGGRDNENQ